MAELLDVKLIDGTARSVRELFTGRKYQLDYYQREYAWSEGNVAELIHDVVGSFLEDFDDSHPRERVASYRPYFLGPIVTAAKDGGRFVVDGQQRLTTLTLLLIHLHHLSKDMDGAESLDPLVFSTKFGKPTFNIDVPERNEVMKAILEGEPFDPNGSSESVQNLWNRYESVVEAFPDELKGKALLHFIDWLLERVVLVEIGTTDGDMALEIFETMNDRGQRLSNTDMLKSFLLARMDDEDAIAAANKLWRRRVAELAEIDRDASSEFIKHWLRGKYANTIRERKKDATARDFDLIGTAFHKWARDNRAQLGLEQDGASYVRFVGHDFDRMSRRYMELLRASEELTPGFEALFYVATTGFTLQYLPILAAVTPDDDDDTFRLKTRLIASYLDLFVARRMVNFHNFGYSTVVYTLFNLAKDVRNQTPEDLRQTLANRVADLDESFEGISSYRLTQRNRSHVRYLLARMTAWVEERCGTGIGFAAYVDRNRPKPFEVEHIWANHFKRHETEFSNPHDFEHYRDQIGDLILLPKDFNASYGDKDYSEKVPHYLKHNLLAASLNELAYENDPSFKKFIAETGLPFRPYESEFRKADIDERQELYRQICDRVWDPAELGLDGGTPSGAKQSGVKPHYDVKISDLVASGLLVPNETVTRTYKGTAFTATVTADGTMRTEDGVEYWSPSGASDAISGQSTNGWRWWRVERDGREVELSVLRAAHLEAVDIQAPDVSNPDSVTAVEHEPDASGYQTQRVTEKDIEGGRIRIPVTSDTKRVCFPLSAGEVLIRLRGNPMTVQWDPRYGPDKERSGVLSVGRGVLEDRVHPDEVLGVSLDNEVIVLE